MSDENNLLSKVKAIHDLHIEMMNTINIVINTLNKGNSPYAKVNQRRAFKIVALAMRVRMIKSQIDIVKAQPNFPSGGLSIVDSK